MANLSEEQSAARQRMRIAANSNLRLYIKDSPHRDLDWDFQCECGGAACDAEVPLTLMLYDDLRESDEFVLAAGHSLQRPGRARAWLRKTRDQAA